MTSVLELRFVLSGILTTTVCAKQCATSCEVAGCWRVLQLAWLTVCTTVKQQEHLIVCYAELAVPLASFARDRGTALWLAGTCQSIQEPSMGVLPPMARRLMVS